MNDSERQNTQDERRAISRGVAGPLEFICAFSGKGGPSSFAWVMNPIRVERRERNDLFSLACELLKALRCCPLLPIELRILAIMPAD